MSKNMLLVLPSRLATTGEGQLPRVFDALHRYRASGTLVLRQQVGGGWLQHRIGWREGLISRVSGGRSSDDGDQRPRQLRELAARLRGTTVLVRFEADSEPGPAGVPPLDPHDAFRRSTAADHGRMENHAASSTSPLGSPGGQALQAACDTLGVPPEADPSVLRAAFRQRARQWHPDRHTHGGPARVRCAEQLFLRAVQAYAQLERQGHRRE